MASQKHDKKNINLPTNFQAALENSTPSTMSTEALVNIIEGNNNRSPTSSSVLKESTPSSPSSLTLTSVELSEEMQQTAEGEGEEEEQEKEYPSLLRNHLELFEKEFPEPKRSVIEKERKIRQKIAKVAINSTEVGLTSLMAGINLAELNSLNVKEFQNVKELSNSLVHGILQRATFCANNIIPEESEIDTSVAVSKSDGSSSIGQKEFIWPKICDFKIHKIPEIITDYIKRWKLAPIYKFYVIRMDPEQSTYSIYHRARAIFSTPTPNCPNPQATVSVYFKFEISGAVPNSTPVYVTYKFEGQNQIHQADNRFKFQEGVIRTLLCCKLKVFSELHF